MTRIKAKLSNIYKETSKKKVKKTHQIEEIYNKYGIISHNISLRKVSFAPVYSNEQSEKDIKKTAPLKTTSKRSA